MKVGARGSSGIELFLAAAIALAVHGLAVFNLSTLPDMRSLLYAPASKSCDECAISMDLSPPPETLPSSLNVPRTSICTRPEPLEEMSARFVDIDYLHFPTAEEASKALDDETIPRQSLIHLKCMADETGKLSDCQAETHTPLAPLAAATVHLFETAARVKPVKGKSVSAPYPVRLSYIWAATA